MSIETNARREEKGFVRRKNVPDFTEDNDRNDLGLVTFDMRTDIQKKERIETRDVSIKNIFPNLSFAYI